MKQTKIIHEYKSFCNNILTLLELIGFEEDHFNLTHMNAKKSEGGGRTPVSHLNRESTVESPNKIIDLQRLMGGAFLHDHPSSSLPRNCGVTNFFQCFFFQF